MKKYNLNVIFAFLCILSMFLAGETAGAAQLEEHMEKSDQLEASAEESAQLEEPAGESTQLEEPAEGYTQLGEHAEESTQDSTEYHVENALEEAQNQGRSGLVQSEGFYYYLKKGIIQRSRLIKEGKKARYFKKSGKAAADEIIKIGKKRYYFNAKAVLGKASKDYTVLLRTGLYYINKDGTAGKQGWKKIKKKNYYCNKSGKLCVGLCELKGIWYYFLEDGVLAQSRDDRIVTIGKKEYVVKKDGRTGNGWCLVEKKCYCCKKDGEIRKNTTVNGIKIKKNGVASRTPTSLRLQMRAESIVRSITSPGMSQGAKIRNCWNYITSHSRFYYSTAYYPSGYSQSEFRRLALLMLNGRAGNCYCFASAFAALTKAAGCNSYVVYGLCPGSRDGRADGMTRHCWVYIAGYGYFDPEARYAGFAYIYGSGGNPWSAYGRIAI